VPHPGVYVTAACFGNDVYEDDRAEDCLSNLLLSEIRRYVIDVYWDTVNRKFSLCPVEIPAASSNDSEVTSSEGSIVTATTAISSSIGARQITATSSSELDTIQASATAASTAAAYTVVSSNDGDRVLQLGPYQCSDKLTLESITSIFNQYMDRTSNTIDAKLYFWILNLHVASSFDQPNTPRTHLSFELLPNSTENIATQLDNLEDLMYGPDALLDDRQNLNSSWFQRTKESELPLTTYFDTFTLPSGLLATDSGWPSEEYIQVRKGKRMLVGFGEIDSGMSDYNTSMDSGIIYPSNYISDRQHPSWSSNAQITSGCYYDENEYSVSQVNNSWAVATINSINPPDLGALADNLTSCGFSQLLNVTINGMTADSEPHPYQEFGDNAIFSWAKGQPENDTSRDVDDEQEFRCALMLATDAYRGHWRVEYCSEQHRVACREAESPYRWRFSSYSVAYEYGDEVCNGNTSFDVPRTGLENTYLYNRILDEARNDESLLHGVWINFNSLDHENCWVTTGVNGSCPYYEDASATRSTHILIPALAALIVLLLTVLTILAKCTSNARNGGSRRRGDGGWDYEGVPS